MVGKRALYQKFLPPHAGIPPGPCQSWMWVTAWAGIAAFREPLRGCSEACTGSNYMLVCAMGWDATQVHGASWAAPAAMHLSMF